MNDSMPLPDKRESPERFIQEEAARWLLRVRSEEATAEDYRDLERWLAEDARRRDEFERLSSVWASLRKSGSLFEKEIAEAEETWARGVAGPVSVSSRDWWPTRMAVTAAMLALVALTSVWWVLRAPAVAHYETSTGEQRQVTLADGTSVMLNTKTRMAVEFSERTRAVRLDRGEAWFMVAPDGQRPFHVEVGNGIIRDIGTQFIVRALPQQVRVSVVDGLVEVGMVDLQGASMAPAVLHGGEQVSFATDGGLSEIGRFDPVTEGAWKDGTLIFKRRPLGQVLADVARYRREDIRLLDQTLADMPVTAVFKIQDLETSLEMLQEILPIRVRWMTADVIAIDRAPAPSPSDMPLQ